MAGDLFPGGVVDPVSLTRAMVRVGALSGDEGGVAEVARQAMIALGYDEVRVDRLGNVTGLVGPGDAPVQLLFDGHMDVVEASGNWSRDPFSGDFADGAVHGRGTTDMKGPLAAAICGVAQAARDGALNHRVAVSASVLEEVVEGAALAQVLDDLDPAMVVICEPSNLRLKTSQRGRIELMVEVAGIPSHAAYPERGKNAIELAAKAIDALSRLEMPVDPVLGGMVLVPTDIISVPHPSVSALPSAVRIRLDRRTGTADTAESVVGEVEGVLRGIDPTAFRVHVTRDRCRTYTGVELDAARDLPAWSTLPDSPLVLAARSCLAQSGLPDEPDSYAFCTNGSESAGRRGIPTIGLGPGREQDAHTIDESIAVDALERAAGLYRMLVRRLAGA